MADRSAGRTRYQWGLVLLAAALLVAWLFVDGPGTSSSVSGTDSGAGTDSGLPVVQVADLPPEAARVLELIDAGGPFDEDEDGGTFQNREEILPDQPLGYYREYTVPTPGSDDRGARRIVVGEDGDFYYTGDHYSSFSRIDRSS